MVETFTPAVCGSRRRQRLALAGFAVGAVAASALVGAALGAVGALLGTQLAFLVAALALLAAAREAGIVRLSLPQLRRQVLERWRSELPLPVWSVGYGVGLGLGFLTFQPVATFWVACAAAVALGKPLAAGLCFAAYGAGRALMTAWPRHGQADATAAVESLARRRRLLLLGNVLALLVCAGLLAAAPAAGAAIQIQDRRCRSRSRPRRGPCRAGTHGLGKLECLARAARRGAVRSPRRRRSCRGRRPPRLPGRAGSEGDRLANRRNRRPCGRTGDEARPRLALARVRAHGLDLQAARGCRLHESSVPDRARDRSDRSRGMTSDAPRSPPGASLGTSSRRPRRPSTRSGSRPAGARSSRGARFSCSPTRPLPRRASSGSGKARVPAFCACGGGPVRR